MVYYARNRVLAIKTIKVTMPQGGLNPPKHCKVCYQTTALPLSPHVFMGPVLMITKILASVVDIMSTTEVKINFGQN